MGTATGVPNTSMDPLDFVPWGSMVDGGFDWQPVDLDALEIGDTVQKCAVGIDDDRKVVFRDFIFRRHEMGTTLIVPDGIAPVIRDGKFIGVAYMKGDLS